jgi:gluconolactonase
MKRTLPLLVLLLVTAQAVACNNDDTPAKKNTPAGGDGNTPAANGDQPATPGGDNATNPGEPTAADATTNPTDGLAPATSILEAGAYTDGPVWHAGMGALFFSTPLGDGALYRMLPDGRVLKVRAGVNKDGTQPIGNTVSPSGLIITAEAKALVSMPAAGGDPKVIATTYTSQDKGPPDPLNPNAPAPPATQGPFDTLNDVVSRKDGTMYVTDPGYFATPVANRIYRVTPQGKVSVVEAFDDVPRPNGIALSPDEKSLYVGFSAPVQGTLPFIRKYTVNADGTLGEWSKFIDVGPADSAPDGLAVDKVGNLYVAAKDGIEVYKPDGNKWGVIAVPEKPTGITFGGKDLKTLYITTEGVKIWQVSAKLAGLSQ